MSFTTLGLLGPAGSGKDLVADWFGRHGFVKVGFADPIKRFVQNCFSIGDSVLWGPSELRNNELSVDEDWWFTAFGKFGVASGEIVQKILSPETRATGYIALHEWLTDLRKNYRERISPRIILQTLGTEWGRKVDEEMWVKYLYWVVGEIKLGRTYIPKSGLGNVWKQEDGMSTPSGVIIPDHRFRNEVKYTQEHGGYVLKLRRLALEPKVVGVEGHASEQEQKSIADSEFDHVFEFEEGVDKVHKVLEDAYERKVWLRGSKGRL